MNLFMRLLLLLSMFFLILSCEIPQERDESLSSLIATESCISFDKELKNSFIADMEKRVDLQLDVALYNYMYGCSNDYGSGCGADGNAPRSDAPDSGGNGGSSATEYSETNTQVAGVDEADFVKNDGEYIYILTEDQFKIVDAWPPENAAVHSSTRIEGTPKKLYVHNDKALIYASIGQGYSRSECTYGYDCTFTGDGLNLKITVYDIADKAAPKLERETTFSGSYLNSRRIDNTVHTAVIFPEMQINGLSYWPEDLPRCPEQAPSKEDVSPFTIREIKAAFEKLRSDNRKIINNAELLPEMKDIIYVDGRPMAEEGIFDKCEDLYMSRSPEGKSLLSIVSQKIDSQEPLSATTIKGKPGAIYASGESLYLASRQYRSYFDAWYFAESEQISEATTVHKVSFLKDAAGTEYVGSGVVKGRVLNQFSMDEQDGYLRMATTTGRVPSQNVHSTLLSMKEKKGKLVVAGVVDDIAPTEDIRTVRFNQDVVFIVTFKKTDPLFAFDFSDPENPVLKGELKIPGYSTYMHLMDENHLLTIGYDAEDQGERAYFQGIMLQIFNISDLTKLELIHKEVIGTRGTTSDATTNHLAFNYFPPKNLLALPMVICEESSGGSDYGDIMTFSGLMVYRVTTEEGFDYLGGISHENPETEENCRGACNNWWTRSNSIVKRSIIMDDYVYSVALDSINIANMNDLSNIIASIDLMQF